MPTERRVGFSRDFTRDVKQLKKKFRHIADDVQSFVARLKRGETPGDQIQSVGYTVYKARIRNTDVQRGKSGGYRIIYYLRTEAFIVLLTIYSKTEQEDIGTDEIRRIIVDVLHEDVPPSEQ